MVPNLIQIERGERNRELILSLFSTWNSERIFLIPLAPSFGQHTRVWNYTKDRVLFVKFAYHLGCKLLADWGRNVASSSGCSDRLWRDTWAASLPPKVKMQFWKLFSDSLAKKVNINRRIVMLLVVCPFSFTELKERHALSTLKR